MIYDITSQESFNHVNDWLNEVNRYAAEGTVKILIGNKCDKPNRVVSFEKGQDYAESLGIPFLETSAKNALNIEEAFVKIATTLMELR